MGSITLRSSRFAAAGAVNGSGAIHIHIHGVVTGTPHGGAPGVKLAITIDVAGRPNDLAGAGWDSGTLTTGPTGMKPGGPFPGGPAGACYYTASGSLDGSKVTLVGRSLWTNRPFALADTEESVKSDTRADGRDFNGTADLVTGDITWSLSPSGAAFAGKGLVVLTNGDQVSNP